MKISPRVAKEPLSHRSWQSLPSVLVVTAEVNGALADRVKVAQDSGGEGWGKIVVASRLVKVNSHLQQL